MTVRQLLEAIQDTSIQADIVVGDKGRLRPVTEIKTTENVLMLVCRPHPKDGRCPPCSRRILLQQLLPHALPEAG